MLNNIETHMLVGTALRTLASEPDNATIWSCVRSTARAIGFSYFTAGDAKVFAGDSRDGVYASDLSKEALALIEQERLLDNHPEVQRCLETNSAFTITSLRQMPGQESERWIAGLHETVRKGEGLVVPFYLVIPVFDDTSLAAIFVFGADRPIISHLARAMLKVLAHAAYAARVSAEKRGAQSSNYALTERELQCLRAAAQGMVDPDIGKMLSISARTVRFHIDNSKQKLGVETRMQAITKSLREKLFEI
jgi:DNA-binding CsgD family transcriptional regulator